MKDEQQILEESSLNLALELDHARDSAKDLADSFDIDSESSLVLSDEQEKLAKEIAKRTKLEEKLNKNQKLIDFTQQMTVPETNSTKSESDNKINETVDDLPKTANDLIREQLGTLKEFKSKFIDNANEERKFRKEQRVGLLSNYKKSESLTIRTAGALINNVNNQFSDIVGGLLNQLPGFGVAKNATKFVVDNFKETRELKRNKRLGKQAEATYNTRKEVIKSNFERVSNSDNNVVSTDVKKENEIKSKEIIEKKRNNDLKRDESNKSENRFSRLFKMLETFKNMLMFKSLFGAFSSFSGTIVSAISSAAGFLLTGLGAKFAGVIAGIAGLKSVFSNGIASLRNLLPSFKTSPTDVRTSDNKNTRTERVNRTDGNRNTPDTDIKRKPAEPPKSKKPGLMSRAGTTMSKVFKRVPKLGIAKKITGGAVKRILPALIGGPLGMALSFGLLASDLVDVGKFAYDQFKGESSVNEPAMIMDGDVKSEPKIIIDGADTSQMITGDMLERENETVAIEQEKRRIEEQKAIELRARQAMVSTSVDNRTNVTNIMQSGYTMKYQHNLDNKVF